MPANFRKLRMASKAADELFPHIQADRFNDDESVCAISRMLLCDRIEKGDGFRFSVRSIDAEMYKTEAMFPKHEPEEGKTCSYVDILTPGAYSGDNLTAFNEFKKQSKTLLKGTGYVMPADINAQMGSSNIHGFTAINEKERRTVIYVSALSVRVFQIFGGMLSRLAPWYFKEKPLTGDERAAALALLRGDESFAAAEAAFSERFDFRTNEIRSMIRGFSVSFYERQLRDMEKNLERKERDYNMAYDRCVTALRELRDLQEKHTAATLMRDKKDTSAEDALIEYCIRNRAVHLDSVENSSIVFYVLTYLGFYDVRLAENVIRVKDSPVYRYSHLPSPKDTERFFRALFLDETIRLRMRAAYRLNFSEYRADGIMDFQYGPDAAEYLDNTHISRASCIGGHRNASVDMMRAGDYTGAINEFVVSAGNISIGDGAIFGTFVDDLTRSSRKCIELPDGTLVTPQQASEWLAEKEEQKHESETEKKEREEA